MARRFHGMAIFAPFIILSAADPFFPGAGRKKRSFCPRVGAVSQKIKFTRTRPRTIDLCHARNIFSSIQIRPSLAERISHLPANSARSTGGFPVNLPLQRVVFLSLSLSFSLEAKRGNKSRDIRRSRDAIYLETVDSPCSPSLWRKAKMEQGFHFCQKSTNNWINIQKRHRNEIHLKSLI